MARLFALVGNRADLTSSVLDLERDALLTPDHTLHSGTGAGQVPAGQGSMSWGVGFYQNGEVLLRRRPHDDRRVLDIRTMAGDLRSDLLIGHVRRASVGGLRADNTHPFRYREWLFAHTGVIDVYDRIRTRLLDSIPEFLQRNVRGDTDSEVLFHAVLSFLHDANRLHDRGLADAATLRGALSSTISLLDQLVSEEGGAPEFPINIVLTNGEIVAALHRGDPTSEQRMAVRAIRGQADLDAIVREDALRRVRLTDPDSLRFTLIASDFADSAGAGKNTNALGRAWTTLPSRAIVTVDRDAQPDIQAF